MSLEPESATWLINHGTRRFVVATVHDAGGQPVAGARLRIQVREQEEGRPINERTQAYVTDTRGHVSLAFSGQRPLRMELVAWIDEDNDRIRDPEEPADRSTIVFRPTRGPARPALVRGTTWYLRRSLTEGPADLTFAFGPGGIPLMGDWDGDGTDTPGWYREATFYLRNTNTAGPPDVVFAYGREGDRPVVGDWDGNGTDTVGVVRGGLWYLRNSTDYRQGGGRADVRTFGYGLVGDLILAGDWDRDGRLPPESFATDAGTCVTPTPVACMTWRSTTVARASPCGSVIGTRSAVTTRRWGGPFSGSCGTRWIKGSSTTGSSTAATRGAMKRVLRHWSGMKPSLDYKFNVVAETGRIRRIGGCLVSWPNVDGRRTGTI